MRIEKIEMPISGSSLRWIENSEGGWYRLTMDVTTMADNLNSALKNCDKDYIDEIMNRINPNSQERQ